LNSGFITGVRRADEKNRVPAVDEMQITVKGRLFLEELENKEAAKMSIGLLKQNWWGIYKLAFAILAGVIITLLSQLAKEHFFGSNKAPAAPSYSSNYWVSATPVANGNGTLWHPYDGSNRQNFDNCMLNMPTNCTIHLLAGTYQTYGVNAW